MTSAESVTTGLWSGPVLSNRSSLKKRIHCVQTPALLLWGREDRLVPPAYAEEFRSRVPGAQVEMVARAGHLLMVEHPAHVAARIEAFLR